MGSNSPFQTLANLRRRNEQRVADAITAFSGTMTFVLLHVVWFAFWVIYNTTASHPFDKFPFGLLTLIVSLEAIFLSTFVLISQNRADERRQVLADQEWRTVQDEEQQNETLLQLSTEILELTKEIHGTTPGPAAAGRPGSGARA